MLNTVIKFRIVSAVPPTKNYQYFCQGLNCVKENDELGRNFESKID